MHFQNIIGAVACAVLVCSPTGCSKEAQAEPQAESSQRSADDLLSGMRMKSLMKDLELTDDQKVKVQVLFDEEAAAMAKVNADTNLSTTQRLNRIAELKKETYGKIRPLLNPAQAENLDQMLAKTEKRRKRN